jgi:hypothetical protein
MSRNRLDGVFNNCLAQYILLCGVLGFAQAVNSQSLKSTAGDGIPDDWKIHGVALTFADGTHQTIQLTVSGSPRKTSPNHKAVLVWVDWMADNTHTHKPGIASDLTYDPHGLTSRAPSAIENVPLQRVVDAFAAAPVHNIDGVAGVDLVLIFGDQFHKNPIQEQTTLGSTTVALDKVQYNWGAFDYIKNARLPVSPPLFRAVVHYAMFIHQMPDPLAVRSGLSNGIPGNEFLVSLGAAANQVGDVDQQGGTFMHELGHNLGLDHGGFEDVGNKPNYLSVMNYLFQFTGLGERGVWANFTYSSFAVDIDENNLNEQQPLATDLTLNTYNTAHLCGDRTFRIVPHLSCPVNWSCTNSDSTEACDLSVYRSGMFSQDVNQDGAVTALRGFNDWQRIESLLSSTSPLGGGAPIRKMADPSKELEVNAKTLLSVIPISNVITKPLANGIDVTWARIPLQRVVGYELVRQAPGTDPIIIRRTIQTEFVDTTAKAGVRYSYSVRPLLVLPTLQQVQDVVSSTGLGIAHEATGLLERANKLNLRVDSVGLVRGRASSSAAASRQ